MSLEAVKERMKSKMDAALDIKGRFKFDFGEDGRIFIDNSGDTPVISEEDEDADVTLMTSIDMFQGFLDGTQDPSIAFMMGKLKVAGSVGLAMKLNSLLED